MVHARDLHRAKSPAAKSPAAKTAQRRGHQFNDLDDDHRCVRVKQDGER